MKIRQKLIFGFLAVVALTAILGIVNIVGINKIGAKAAIQHTVHSPIAAAVSNLRIDVEEIVRATEEYDSAWMTEEDALKEIEERKNDIETRLERLVAVPNLLAIEEIQHIKVLINEIFDLSNDLFLLHGKTRADKVPAMEGFDNKVEELDITLNTLLERIDKASETSSASIVSTVASSRIINISLLAVVILGALAIAFAISRSVSNPIAKMRNAAIEIGKGDLSKRAQINSKDEIGDLAASFNQMADEVQKRNEQLKTAGEELRAFNEELEAANEELKATEEELRASNEELEASNDELKEAQDKLVRSEKLAAIGQLAGGVGHELRNPLGAIKNAVYYIKGKVAKSELAQQEPRVMEFLGIMDEEINSSDKIISDLLNFSRVGKPAVSPARIDKLIEDSISHTAIPENIELTKNFSSTLSEVEVDTDQIRQVLVNIITNAVQAMPEGGKLTIAAASQDGFLEVAVADNGTGIPEEARDKIFDPLYTMKAKGIGLGLAVCKSIIDRHGGCIEVKSEMGKGTVFTIKLPLNSKQVLSSTFTGGNNGEN